jgi:hypothetical protein
VHVQNLELLSVLDIQEIEKFVVQRKGIFDFNTYSFVIQKKLDFFEFEKLMQESSLHVRCVNTPLKSTNNPRIGFGEYKGMQYSELPDSYILWLRGNYSGKDKSLIETECKRRRI